MLNEQIVSDSFEETSLDNAVIAEGSVKWYCDVSSIYRVVQKSKPS